MPQRSFSKTLSRQPCQPYNANATALTLKESEHLLSQLNHWHIDTNQPTLRLVKAFTFNNYQQCIDFAMAVASLAEANNHHPQIIINWGEVQLHWWTHKLKGLHLNDFILADRCDALLIKIKAASPV